MPELADIFRRYGAAYLQQFDHTLLPSHRRAIEDILDCRTEARGGHVYVCDHCGRSQYAYHSCRNRSCPKCHQQQTEAWLQARRAELLPVAYFHVVFTVPQELRRCLRGHQKTLYGILMQAAAGSLIKLAADPHYVGGLIGVLATLQTWTRTLAYHPHVHCLVPAGGVCADRRTWLDARATYLVPERALSRIFRGLFSELVARRAPQLRLPDAIWHTDWVVYCKPTIQGTQRVLDYLGRYVHRVAITNRRIVSIDDGQVTFRYKHARQACWKTMTLPAEEFIRRFLQHVLPKRFHKVRYYGLWSPTHRLLLRQVQLQLQSGKAEPVAVPPSSSPGHEGHPTDSEQTTPVMTCPHCGVGTLVWSARLPRPQRAPP
jgi:hypothetical protein